MGSKTRHSDPKVERLRIFAERWAVHRNATQAAIEAAEAVGKPLKNRNSAGVWGKKAMMNPMVTARVKEVVDGTMGAIRESKSLSLPTAIADVAEVMSVLTQQMRGEKPWRMRTTKTTVDGVVQSQTHTAVVEQGVAASRLLDHFDGVGQAPDSGEANAIRTQVLVVLEDRESRRSFDEIAARIVPRGTVDVTAISANGGNGNGNGHKKRGEE